MRILCVVLVVCLAGAASAKSLQEVEELLQALREAIQTADKEAVPADKAAVPEGNTKGEAEVVKVNEKGVVFAERIAFDDANNCETLHVPAHNERAEVDIRHCFDDKKGSSGTSMYCITQESHCFLLPVAKEGEPGLQQQEEGIQEFENQNNAVLDANGIDVQDNKWVITGVADRSGLPEPLATFNPDFKVFYAAKIDEDAVILQESAVVPEENDKRSLFGGCSNGAIPQTMYAVTDRNGCEYLVFCDRHPVSGTADCPRRHVTDTFFLTCLCCPGTTHHSQCLYCNDLTCNHGCPSG
ncbi:uncharacterized protein LOC144916126 [Branchiostoma floridae x Branchiostoma belcheri]